MGRYPTRDKRPDAAGLLTSAFAIALWVFIIVQIVWGVTA